jgi:hypothetical protein
MLKEKLERLERQLGIVKGSGKRKLWEVSGKDEVEIEKKIAEIKAGKVRHPDGSLYSEEDDNFFLNVRFVFAGEGKDLADAACFDFGEEPEEENGPRSQIGVIKSDGDYFEPLPVPSTQKLPEIPKAKEEDFAETWKMQRETWAASVRAGYDPLAGEIANMLEGLTPYGRDKQGRKVSFVEIPGQRGRGIN